MKITIKNLSKTIESLTVLNDINVEFRSGKTYGIIGKAGSGKTMLLAVICGLVFPTEGYIEIDGKIVGEDISFPKDVGALVGEPGFVSSYDGFTNLKVLARLRNRASDDDIISVMEEVGLEPADKTCFKDYTNSMKQKLGIAAALMECSDLVILDDPFYSLDEESVKTIRKSIQKRKSADSIIILSCQDDKRVEKLCDKILIIEEGRVADIKERRGNNRFRNIKNVIKLFFSFITAEVYRQ